MLESTFVLGMRVDVTSTKKVIDKISNDIDDNKGHYISVSNVHMCMETFDNIEFRQVVNDSDIVVPDGRPIFLAQKFMGAKNAKQVRGQDLMMAICEWAEKNQINIGLFGSSDKVLLDLEKILISFFPSLKISYMYSPPFRKLTPKENTEIMKDIKSRNAGILFVGLGCPKQEMWMSQHKSNFTGYMVGVGAAFDFISGNKRHAPRWVQMVSLEWVFRLLHEPGRLYKRYLIQNPRFMWYFIIQYVNNYLK